MITAWDPALSRMEIVSRALSRVGGAGSLPDDWRNPAPNCLEFVAQVYGYPLGDMTGRVGEITELWSQVRAMTGWRLRSPGADPVPADLLGLRFRDQGHVGVYVGSGQFVHVLGTRIRASTLKYWKKNGLEILAVPERG